MFFMQKVKGKRDAEQRPPARSQQKSCQESFFPVFRGFFMKRKIDRQHKNKNN